MKHFINTFVVLYLVMNFVNYTEAFAQRQGKQSKKAGEILEWIWDTLKNTTGPPPTLEELKSIKRKVCELLPDNCSQFPRASRRIYRFNNLYAFPHLNSSAVFYNDQQSKAVVLPLRVLLGIEKAVAYLKEHRANPSNIVAWLLPVSSHHYNSIESEGDCYIFKSRNGYVRVKFEGNSFSGEMVSIKIISEELPRKFESMNKNLRLRLNQPLPASSLCAMFDEFKAYWEKSFDI